MISTWPLWGIMYRGMIKIRGKKKSCENPWLLRESPNQPGELREIWKIVSFFGRSNYSCNFGYVGMYICIYVYMYICIYVYMYICIYVYMYICIYVYMYICIYVYMYICIYVYMYICIYVYMYIYVHMYIYIYIDLLKDLPGPAGSSQVSLNRLPTSCWSASWPSLASSWRMHGSMSLAWT